MILERPFVDGVPVKDTEIAWLSGVWDGEGSVGAFKNSPTNIRVQAQLQMTDRPTVDRILIILDKIGVAASGFGFQEKKAHHKDAFHVRVIRAQDILVMAKALMPYSITKFPMWEAALEICQIKMSRRRVMPDGRLSRGGKALFPPNEREIELGDILVALNYRKKPSDMEVSE